MPVMRAICEFLAVNDRPTTSDLIFVLAGRPERKSYGLRLFQEGFAARIILSVGRFEVRQVAKLGLDGELGLRELASRTSTARRHFFVDLTSKSQQVAVAGLLTIGTYSELGSLAAYLESDTISSILLVSTSIHLRRVRWCCQQMGFFHNKKIGYVAVPEDLSSFRRRGWWKNFDHWSYVATEYGKLVAYGIRYRHAR